MANDPKDELTNKYHLVANPGPRSDWLYDRYIGIGSGSLNGDYSFTLGYPANRLSDESFDGRELRIVPRRPAEVRILAKANPMRHTVILCTDRREIEPLEIAQPSSADQLFGAMRRYAVMIAERYGYTVSVVRPNLYSAYHEAVDPPKPKILLPECARCGKPVYAGDQISANEQSHSGCVPAPVPVEPDFEVNMMEALVGWKAWKIRKVSIAGINLGMLLYSQHDVNTPWYPDKAYEAKCQSGRGCTAVPAEKDSCGIYAAGKVESVLSYGTIVGEVSGWGRYVRGEDGWRAQYAYPKAFHLIPGQEDLIDALKVYHVPIYVQQPLRIYDPAEEGYDGNRETETNGDSGTAEESDSGQA
jgi:hypothetical protein